MGLYDFIEGGYELMQEYADEAFQRAMEFLDALEEAAGAIDIPSATFTWNPLPDIPGMKIADPPAEVDIEAVYPNAPSDFVPGPIYPPNIEEAPDFEGERPNIVYPNKPSPEDPGDVPTVPDVDTDFIYPDVPVVTMPDTPVLEDILLPTLDPIEFPEFSATMPTDDLEAPGLTFRFTEEDYDSALLAAVQAELADRVTNGGTGLNPVVEQAIWDRAKDREDQLALKAVDETRGDFAARGHTLIPGAELDKIAEIHVDTLYKLTSINRDISIKQAELEQANIQHAISETIRLESVLVNNWNDIMQRKFAVAQYTQEAAINIFNAEVSLYNTRVQAYNIEASVFNTLVQAELGKVEVYRAQIEAQSLINQINKTTVEIYSEQVRALTVQIDLYNAQLQGIRTQLEAEKTKIDIYLGEMQGYTAKLDAIKTEYEAYKIEVDAETSKVDLYSADVSAYASRIQAYSAEVDAQKSVSDIVVAQERLRLDSYLGQLQSYTARIQAETARVTSEADVYKTQVDAYGSRVDAYAKEFTGGLEVYKGALSENESRTRTELAQAEINITKAVEENKVLIESIKAGAMVSAEVASAALTAINLSAGMEARGTENTNHNYDYEV